MGNTPIESTNRESCDAVSKILEAVRALPEQWARWPGGWPDQAEAALLDAVLSIRTRYGQPHNGVRGAISRWQTVTARNRADDLTVLADWTPSSLADVIGMQILPGGNLKAQAIIEVAGRLVSAGVRHAVDVDPGSDSLRRAYLGVRGLGPVTWEYFLMLLGRPGVKADRWITRFVHEATRKEYSPASTRSIVLDAARELGVNPIVLDHAIWYYMRTRATYLC